MRLTTVLNGYIVRKHFWEDVRLIGILYLVGDTACPCRRWQNGRREGIFDTVDGFFGQYFVGPLASVMFFDIYPFDDTLPMGEGVGSVIDGQKVVAHQDGSYVLSTVYELDEGEVVPTLLEPIQNENPIFTWTLEIQDSQLVAIIPSGSYEQLPQVKLESLDGYEKDISNIMGQRDPSKRYFVTTELTMANVPVVFSQDIIVVRKMSLKGMPLILFLRLFQSQWTSQKTSWLVESFNCPLGQ